MISNKKGNNKVSRVKVAVRCRPPFQDEIEFAKGEFFSIVDVRKEEPETSKLGQISLMTMSGKTRDFYFDYAFGEDTSQDTVYDRLARPVVSEVLKGCNGTIFAYGQTGTGKTYTMGILEFVNNEHAGLIPRATYQIFEHIQNVSNADINVSISFLQLYRETIQDLLSPAMNNNTEGENLQIREDPIRGFYVEGLQEFAVRNYGEAEALINLGLENRAIAPTLMNATSSRSHIVLTINIEQKVFGEGNSTYSKTLRSKLLMVDLAGSERVRRTISKGTRLSEAKSINTSLSALGNVIAALAEQSATHIPYRDSKLTRLLQDSLGGTASTALIATIGPAAVNYGETLSTLLFAQRCMAVKITPIPHEEVDYAEMCAKLQSQLNSMEGIMTEKLVSQQETYENMIRSLTKQLEEEKLKFQQFEYENTIQPIGGNTNEDGQNNHHQKTKNDEAFNQELYQLFVQLEKFNYEDGEIIESSWLRKPASWSPKDENDENLEDLPNGQLVSLLAYCYELIKYLMNELMAVMKKNQTNEEIYKENLATQFEKEVENEKNREWELSNMSQNDPRYISLVTKAVEKNQQLQQQQSKSKGNKSATSSTLTEEQMKEIIDEHNKLSFHLAPLTHLEALTRVEGQFRSNNVPISQFDRDNIFHLPLEETNPILTNSFYNFESLQEIGIALIHLRNSLTKSVQSIHISLERKDYHYKSIKTELTNQLVEKRKREEEVINWSYILKYLLASSSKLRKELNQEKRLQSQFDHHQNQQQQLQENQKKKNKNGKKQTPIEDISMQSDLDKLSLNESIIHRLENTILNNKNNNSNQNKNININKDANRRRFSQRSGTNNEETYIPFADNDDDHDQNDEISSNNTSDQPPPPPPATKNNNNNKDYSKTIHYKPPVPPSSGNRSNPPNNNKNNPEDIEDFPTSAAQAAALDRVKMRSQIREEETSSRSKKQNLPAGFVQQHSHRKNPVPTVNRSADDNEDDDDDEEEEEEEENDDDEENEIDEDPRRPASKKRSSSIHSQSSVGKLFNFQDVEAEQPPGQRKGKQLQQKQQENDEDEEEEEEEEQEIEEDPRQRQQQQQQQQQPSRFFKEIPSDRKAKQASSYPPVNIQQTPVFANHPPQGRARGYSSQQDGDEDLDEEERFSLDDSEYSLTSTTRSFRSAATPNSIPMPRYRKSTKKAAAMQQQQQPPPQQQGRAGRYANSNNNNNYRDDYDDEEEDYDDEGHSPMVPNSLNSRRSQQPQQQQQFQAAAPQQPPSLSSRGSARPPAQAPQLRQQGGAVSAPAPVPAFQTPNLGASSSSAASNPLTRPMNGPFTPSLFAQEIVKNLGVTGNQAMSVMSVIDRVKDITPDQLQTLDPETRDQIIQIRKDLGIDEYILSNEQRRKAAEEQHIQRTRASSNQRARPGPSSPGKDPQQQSIDPMARSRSNSASSAAVRSITPSNRGPAGGAARGSSGPGSRPQSRERPPSNSSGRSGLSGGMGRPVAGPGGLNSSNSNSSRGFPGSAGSNSRQMNNNNNNYPRNGGRSGGSGGGYGNQYGYEDDEDDDDFSQIDFMR